MNVSEARTRFGSARVARLATIGADGAAHLVPCVFFLQGDTVYSPVDHKPKRSTDLVRLRNLRRDARATLLADHYEEEWASLWWVRAQGAGRILDTGEEHATAVGQIHDKYPQYRATPISGPVIAVDVEGWSWWSAQDGGGLTRIPATGKKDRPE